MIASYRPKLRWRSSKTYLIKIDIRSAVLYWGTPLLDSTSLGGYMKS